DREREDPVQPAEQLGAVAQVEVQQHLGVAVALEAVAVLDELAPQLAVVVELAVVDDRGPPGGVPHRLVAARRGVDDREAPVRKAEPRLGVEERPRVVGATVGDRAVHPRQELRVEVPREAGYPAHASASRWPRQPGWGTKARSGASSSSASSRTRPSASARKARTSAALPTPPTGCAVAAIASRSLGTSRSSKPIRRTQTTSRASGSVDATTAPSGRSSGASGPAASPATMPSIRWSARRTGASASKRGPFASE